jgi:hypothetical protein
MTRRRENASPSRGFDWPSRNSECRGAEGQTSAFVRRSERARTSRAWCRVDARSRRLITDSCRFSTSRVISRFNSISPNTGGSTGNSTWTHFGRGLRPRLCGRPEHHPRIPFRARKTRATPFDGKRSAWKGDSLLTENNLAAAFGPGALDGDVRLLSVSCHAAVAG